MSNYIRVNHSRFGTVATEIDTYVSRHNKNMRSADQEVAALSSTWQGQDFIDFENQWHKVMDNDSTSRNMTKSLENYADFLRYAGSQYKEAQARAVNKANRLF